jgi:hypothetical protein
MEKNKSLRRDNPEYQEIRIHKASYKADLKRLFLNLPDWQKISRAAGVLNVPTLIDDRLRMQANIKRKYQPAN